eukprot:Hpha_TRINITY_DN16678_c1_g2::TRINITY_DN16678_c1_g2_i1::g.183878::m.183878/K00232/E1.3.3.6, ACOX1, ACOX3; acyl-CoA oxidase
MVSVLAMILALQRRFVVAYALRWSAAFVAAVLFLRAVLRFYAALQRRFLRPKLQHYVQKPNGVEASKALTQWMSLVKKNQLYEHSSYTDSAEAARDVVQKGPFRKWQDFVPSGCSKLFICHREGAGGLLEAGLGTRFTVQFNLFAGTVANLGSDEQREWLNGTLAKGELGCFLLTEHRAGVLSGLIVDTTATWTPKGYVLNSPNPEDSKKVWISQGMVAEWGVVLARLILPEGDMGPHAFIMDLRSEGVEREEMGKKTAMNSLDNANITFDNVALPHSSLLSRISSVDDAGAYHINPGHKAFKFENVAQRLLSGRICLSSVGLLKLRELVDDVEKVTALRSIPAGRDRSILLSDLPALSDAMAEIRALRQVMTVYVRELEREFIDVDEEVSAGLVHRIACAKILVSRLCLRSLNLLRERAGAIAMLADGPFGSKNDCFYAVRFAEGDSAILIQKMARDLLKPLMGPIGMARTLAKYAMPAVSDRARMESEVAGDLLSLARNMYGHRGNAKIDEWFSNHALVETIATKTAIMTVHDVVSKKMAGTQELDWFQRKYIAGERVGVSCRLL